MISFLCVFCYVVLSLFKNNVDLTGSFTENCIRNFWFIKNICIFASLFKS